MTFTEDTTVAISSKRSEHGVGYALDVLLSRANDAGQVVTGVIECAQVLQSSPEQIDLCILGETDDVTAQIHHKLVEAFCLENDIAVLKVDKYKKSEDGNTDNDFGCLLIQSNTSDQSNTNELIQNYYTLRANQHLVACLPE